MIVYDLLVAPLEYPFMQRALLASVLVGVTAGVIGSYMLVRRWSLMGDAISHAVLPGVALAYLLGVPYFVGSLVTGVLTAAGIGYVERNSRIKSDAAMGILFVAAFALGLAILSRIRSTVDLYHILFGNVLAVSAPDLWLMLATGLAVLVTVFALWKELHLWSFDPVSAQVVGLPVRALHYLLMLLLSVTIVAALQAVGIVLVVAMLVTPVAAAYLLTRRFVHMMLLAAGLGAVAGVIGLYLSFHLNVASGAAMVLVATLFFVLTLLFAPDQGLLARAVARLRARRLVTIGLAAATGLALVLVLSPAGPGDPARPARGRADNRAAAGAGADGRPLQVVTTLNIVGDLARRVAGDRAQVHSLLAPGVDPHVYEPTPRDGVAVAEADIVFVNGLGLEGWMEKLVRGGDGPPVVELAGPDMDLLPWTDGTKRWDPHLWMDPRNAVRYVEKIRDHLTRLDPAGRATYAANAASLVAEIEALDRWAEAQFRRIPPDRRKLVTTHDAYRYFGRRYGLEVLDTVWGISTEEEPSAQDIAKLVEILRRHRVPPFVETTINPEIMEQIAAQAGVAIGGSLYGDSLGPPGSGADSYLGMMRHNVETIVRAMEATLQKQSDVPAAGPVQERRSETQWRAVEPASR